MTWVGGAETWSSQDTNTPPGQWPTNRREVTTTEVLSEEWGVWAPHRDPQPEDPALERQAPRKLGFENELDLFRRDILETEASLLKSAHKISHIPSPSTETIVGKVPGSDPLADLGEPSGEARGNWEAPWGLTCWQQPLLGSWDAFQTSPKKFKRKNTSKFILWGQHHPNSKTRQRRHKKIKQQANITDEHRGENPQQILANWLNNTLKGSYMMIKCYFCHRCKDGSISVNQSICYTTLTK